MKNFLDTLFTIIASSLWGGLVILMICIGTSYLVKLFNSLEIARLAIIAGLPVCIILLFILGALALNRAEAAKLRKRIIREIDQNEKTPKVKDQIESYGLQEAVKELTQ